MLLIYSLKTNKNVKMEHFTACILYFYTYKVRLAAEIKAVVTEVNT